MATDPNGAASSSERATRSAKRRKLNTYGRNTSRSKSSPLQTLNNVESGALQSSLDGDTPLMDVDKVNGVQDQMAPETHTSNSGGHFHPDSSAGTTDSRSRQRRAQNGSHEGLEHGKAHELCTTNIHVPDIMQTTTSAARGHPPRASPRSVKPAAKENDQSGQLDFDDGKENIEGHGSFNEALRDPVEHNLSEYTQIKRKRGRPRKHPVAETEVVDSGGTTSVQQKQHHATKYPPAKDNQGGTVDAKLKPGHPGARKADDNGRPPREEAESTPSRRSTRSQGQKNIHVLGDDTKEKSISPSHRKTHTKLSSSPTHERDNEQDPRGLRRLSNDVLKAQPTKPKGILTPTKRKLGRPKKLVKFQHQEQKDFEHELGFKDIPNRHDFVKTSGLSTTSTPEHDQALDAIELDSSLAGAEHDRQSSRRKPAAGRLSRPNNDIQESSPPRSVVLPQADDEPYPGGLASPVGHVAGFGDLEDESPLFAVLKTVVLGKLTGKRRSRLIGLDEECEKVRQLVEQTAVAGEGNSMIVIGARGSGKSAILESVVSGLAVDHNKDFHVIRLNGFVHTDDKLALREIWRQLGREMEVDEDAVNKTSNYADTLSSLLALLSHPSELARSETDEISKSVIFIMDEFDLFASHPRQTLLYNLFDIAQSRKAPIAVLGLTSRVDVTESLEKRVKSRFSHRYVYISLPKTLYAFWAICKEALTVSTDELLSAFTTGEHGIEGDGLMSGEGSHLLESWNKMIETDLYHDPTFNNLLQSIYYRTKSVKDFFAIALLPIATLTPASLPLTGQSFLQNTLLPPESKLDILPGLGDLELALLIAAARLDIILDTDTCNFNMAYDEYTRLAFRVKVQSSASGAAAVGAGSKIWSREVAMGAWEKLMDYELLVPAIGTVGGGLAVSGTGGGAGSREVGRAGKMIRVDVGLEEILPSVPGMSAVMSKWCREI